MSDLESRLTEALRVESEQAPDALGLADAARGRSRARRRTQVSLGALAVAAAVTVPLAVVGAGGGDDPGTLADGTSASELPPVEIGRWESWHGLTVLVPEDWQYGDQATWCAGGGSADTFRITRPGGMSEMIACTPVSSYGISFQEIEMKDTDEPFDWPVVTQTGEAWPPSTYVGAHGEDGVLVTVAGPDRQEVVDVLATVRPVDGVDPNGCGVILDVDPRPAPETMSVCRYDARGSLEQSEVLTGDDALAAGKRLDLARVGELDCQPSEAPPETIRMQGDRHDVSIELDGACTVIEGMSEPRIADPDVLWWALSPGWTGDATGLPMGSVLRSYDPAAR